MEKNILERYNELVRLGKKVKESAYISSGGLFAGFKYVDNDLFIAWKSQSKNFIHKYFGENSTFYNEYETYENARGMTTNKIKFENLFSLFLSIEYDLKELKSTESKINNSKSNKIFIVHGHDELAISQVSELLRKLGLEPIVLKDQVSQSSTVIEKIEKYTTNIGFGIILYTECDWGGKERDKLKRRARQNVILEHGYLMAKLGRENTVALIKGTVETPGDISGVVYTQMDPHNAWQYKLVDELKASGYKISKDKI